MTPDEQLEQIQRITHGRVFTGSETLCRLLVFLAEKSIHDPEAALKEYRIATEVLGRKDDFDPRLDSSVRVQVTRLRSKLIEYTLTEGHLDPIYVDLPKGAYRLNFAANPAAATEAVRSREDQDSLMLHATSEESVSFQILSQQRQWKFAFFVLLGMLVGIALGMGLFWLHNSTSRVALRPVDPALRTFWAPFLSQTDRVAVFSNASFVGHPDQGMRYFNPKQDHPEDVIDHYTGVGEVLSVHALDSVFEPLGFPVRVRRGALLSMDDVKDSNLIFIGSPVENLVLNDIPSPRFFRFQVKTDLPREGEVGVANLKPNAGEGSFYLHAPTRPIPDDYAIVSRARGLDKSRIILIAAGTTTLGTQGAVEFLCRPEGVQQLLNQLGPGHSADPFEAVLHIKIAKGVPVDGQLVAFRLLP